MLDEKINKIVDILESTETKLSNDEILNHKKLKDNNFLSEIYNITELIDDIYEKTNKYNDDIKHKGLNQLDYNIENLINLLDDTYKIINKKLKINNNIIDNKFEPKLLKYRLNKIFNQLDELEVYIDKNDDVISDELLNDIVDYLTLTYNKLDEESLVSHKEINDKKNDIDDIQKKLDILHDKLNSDITDDKKKAILKQISNVKNSADLLLDDIYNTKELFYKDVSDIKWVSRNINEFFDFNIDLYMRENSYDVYYENKLDVDEKYDVLLLADKMFDKFKEDILNAYFLSSGKIKLKNIPSELEPFISELFSDDFYEFLTNNNYEYSYRDNEGNNEGEENEEYDEEFDEGFDEDFDSNEDEYDNNDEDEMGTNEEENEKIPDDDLTEF